MFSLKLKNLSKLFIVTILFSIMILSITNVANAECPAGYQQGNINFIYRTYLDYPIETRPVTCNIQLTYCYYCSMTGIGFDIQIEEFTEDCNFPINEDFWQQAETAMLMDLLNKTTCIAPCDWNGWTTKTATFSYVSCWKKVHYAGDPIYRTTFKKCEGSATCNYVYKVCVVFDEEGVHLTKVFDHKFPWPGETCSLYGEPENQNIPGYWETGCFMFTSDCPYE